MAFIQHCFIRRNTPVLRERLREIGQRQNEFDDDEGEWLAANYGMFISVTAGFERLNPEDIDCGEDGELFLALAALRDDSDHRQWFISPEGEWDLNMGRVVCRKFREGSYRKAAAEEIVEHFNKGKEERL